jgi:phenylacetic acid degradation operon negative regulatory protein
MSRERNTKSSEPAGESLLERSLTPRSLIASLLLRTPEASMRGARLVQWCALFGVAEGTTRVALSRMVDRGELQARDGRYALAGRVEHRRSAQDWSLDPVLSRWRGDWRVAVVGSGSRDAGERGALRDAMRRMRYGELREGVWTRPDNLPRASAPVESWKVADAQCAWWTGNPDGDGAALAARLFRERQWSHRARDITGRLGATTRALQPDDESSIADAFVAGAASLAHLRADPLLPRELTRDSSAGEELRATYGAYESAFSGALRSWFQRR